VLPSLLKIVTSRKKERLSFDHEKREGKKGEVLIKILFSQRGGKITNTISPQKGRHTARSTSILSNVERRKKLIGFPPALSDHEVAGGGAESFF